MSFNAKRNDVSKFTAGTWVEIFGAHWKVARAGNPEYEQALEDSGYRKKEEPQAKQRALYKAIATGVLKDWKDVEDNDGNAIPYSVENAIEVLMENPDLVGRLLSEANDLANYRRESIKDDKERAVGFSDGKPNGSRQGKASKTPSEATSE